MLLILYLFTILGLIILKLYSIRVQCYFFKDKGEESNSVLVLMIRKYGYIKITCVKDDCIRTIDDINDEVVEKIKEIIK